MARWRSGNAAVCKTAMRGFEPLPRLHHPRGARLMWARAIDYIDSPGLMQALVLSQAFDPTVPVTAFLEGLSAGCGVGNAAASDDDEVNLP